MNKAIETRYRGFRFRSRTEARWAIFMDNLGISWQYEPEGFELPDGSRYLPDFLVETKNSVCPIRWMEVKAGIPSIYETRKLWLLCKKPYRMGNFLTGQPGLHTIITLFPEDKLEFCLDNHEKTVMGLATLFLGGSVDSKKRKSMAEMAIFAARSARFEHGESHEFV